MKIYYYPNKNNINTYFIVEEREKEGIIIDPTNIQKHFIEKIETSKIVLKGCLATNQNIDIIDSGIETLQKLYDFTLCSPHTLSIKRNSRSSSVEHSVFNISSFRIDAFPIRLHNKSVCMYRIGNALFSGLVFLDCLLPLNKPQIQERFERKRLNNIFFSMQENTTLFSLSGPPTTIKTLKFYCLSK